MANQSHAPLAPEQNYTPEFEDIGQTPAFVQPHGNGAAAEQIKKAAPRTCSTPEATKLANSGKPYSVRTTGIDQSGATIVNRRPTCPEDIGLDPNTILGMAGPGQEDDLDNLVDPTHFGVLDAAAPVMDAVGGFVREAATDVAAGGEHLIRGGLSFVNGAIQAIPVLGRLYEKEYGQTIQENLATDPVFADPDTTAAVVGAGQSVGDFTSSAAQCALSGPAAPYLCAAGAAQNATEAVNGKEMFTNKPLSPLQRVASGLAGVSPLAPPAMRPYLESGSKSAGATDASQRVVQPEAQTDGSELREEDIGAIFEVVYQTLNAPR